MLQRVGSYQFFHHGPGMFLVYSVLLGVGKDKGCVFSHASFELESPVGGICHQALE